MIRRIGSLMLAAALLAGPVMAAAQVRGQMGQRQRLELERRVQAGFGRAVRNQLELGQEEFQALQEVMRSFREHRMSLSESQASVRHRLRDPGLENLGESEAVDLLQDMVRVQEEELDLYRREQGELLRVLTPVQLLVFYRVREDIGRQVQQLRGGRGPGGGGPPGSASGVGGRGGVF
jgi:hypothetical protein